MQKLYIYLYNLYKSPHTRGGARNHLLQFSDMLDTWWRDD